jgi:ABC-type glycerol-3-phosphate transport system substrate-binding protein
MLRKCIAAAALVAALCAVAGAGAAASEARAKVTTLTLWHNYGTEGNAPATTALVAAFEKANPDVKITVVSQPAANYFSLLQASSISHSGPDLAVMWTGLWALKYQKSLVNLNAYFKPAELAKMNGIKWVAPDFDTSKGALVMPLENQFYMGFYNKALFSKAHIAAPPRNWNELYAACSKLEAAGITPMVYGADPQAIQTSPYPWYDMSYVIAGVLSPAKLGGLYSGTYPWTSPALVQQVQSWATLPKKGCTNSDVLTKTNILGTFMKGQAAMIMDGSWDAGTLSKALGSKVGAMAMPFTAERQRGVVQFSGDGFAITSYSQHKAEAARFLRFMISPQGSRIIAANGLIPDVAGSRATNRLQNEMLAFVSQKHYVAYPMLDNVVQPDVVSTGQKQLDDALGGNISAEAALKSLKSTWQSLPSDQRGKVYR